jgi:hypothetical protein
MQSCSLRRFDVRLDPCQHTQNHISVYHFLSILQYPANHTAWGAEPDRRIVARFAGRLDEMRYAERSTAGMLPGREEQLCAGDFARYVGLRQDQSAISCGLLYYEMVLLPQCSVDAFVFASGEWLRCCAPKWKVCDVCGSNDGQVTR